MEDFGSQNEKRGTGTGPPIPRILERPTTPPVPAMRLELQCCRGLSGRRKHSDRALRFEISRAPRHRGALAAESTSRATDRGPNLVTCGGGAHHAELWLPIAGHGSPHDR